MSGCTVVREKACEGTRNGHVSTRPAIGRRRRDDRRPGSGPRCRFRIRGRTAGALGRRLALAQRRTAAVAGAAPCPRCRGSQIPGATHRQPARPDDQPLQRPCRRRLLAVSRRTGPARLDDQGHRARRPHRLPVVIQKGWPLEYRIWSPGDPLEHGAANILSPARGPAVRPDIVIAPVVGFDTAHYRLGYGGGFFDRTLATMPRKPVVIGVGYREAEMATIHPQPHDIPMDVVLTD
ncbi:5-formyltetrahydrofolate cyclo-ligase [Mesorhizobium sp. 8]|uniref:5-formyltetrahydrofolate cyclo-ligase n=1 Tax=Mesorhizobium sp. 8 TaxID=2584466 RepID=UPI001FEF1FD2|nr:5-formyltetrahydrofolate cyclo-ligase [Mesorhizobium sp. 8]